MAFSVTGKLHQRFRSRWKRVRTSPIRSVKDHDIRRNLGQPERRQFADAGLWIGGESTGPTARPDPPVLLVVSKDALQCGPGYQRGPAYSRDCDSGIPARNPRSRDRNIDLRSMVTAKTNQRTWQPPNGTGGKAKRQLSDRYR